MFSDGLKENYTKVSYSIVRKVGKVVILTTALALTATPVFANSRLDEIARDIYFNQFIGIAKWIIIGKGAWDTVGKTLKEDFDGAKRTFIQYIVIFCILLGLPAGLDKVSEVFTRV